MKQILIVLFLIVNLQINAQVKYRSETEILSIVKSNAKQLKQKSGAYSVSVGIVKDGKIFTKHFGEIDKDKGNIANDNTYFEIASITKLFTGYLVAKAVLENKINLDDDIRKYLDGSFPNFEYEGKPIKIRNLISYKSALPANLPDERDLMKTITDKTPYLLYKQDSAYSKQQFVKDLKQVKLDTIPGTKYTYSNVSLEIMGMILEKIYKKDFESILKEQLLVPLAMNHTKFNLNQNENLANGYFPNYMKMPHFGSQLLGSSGKRTKSTLGDLMKFMQLELQSTNKTIIESQRNTENSEENWFGYFWDNYSVSENGKFGYKHGGAYGTQTLFSIYPEQSLGICIIVNISGPETAPLLINSTINIANEILNKNKSKENFGYYLEKNNVVFSYTTPKNSDESLVKNISVAGSFNDWNLENKKYILKKKGKNKFQLKVPKMEFEKGKIYLFKFVINKVGWLNPPKNAINVDGTEDNNLTFKID